jgi:cytochrome c biogenesis protein CcmG/thiol:disulfide interchange protein DsbE
MLKLKFIVPLLLFTALGAFLFVGLYRDPRYVPSPLIGKPAPEFTLPSLQTRAIRCPRRNCSGNPGC